MTMLATVRVPAVCVRVIVPELLLLTLPTVVATEVVTVPEPLFVTSPTVAALDAVTDALALAVMLPVWVTPVKVSV